MSDYQSGTKPINGIKDDYGKADLSLLPPNSLVEVALVMMYGATKYSRHNWRKGLDHSRLTSACLRHINKYIDGIDYDPESSHKHLAHAAANLLMLLESQTLGYGNDDRYKKD